MEKKGNAKNRAELDAKFAKYSAMLTPEYKLQFKSNKQTNKRTASERGS